MRSSGFMGLYNRLVFTYPAVAIVIVLVASLALGSFAPNFRLDASSDTLALENDQSLKYFREIVKRYGSQEYLIITWTPKDDDLYSDANLGKIGDLRDDLAAMDAVDTVLTILDVPLINSPPVALTDLANGIQTLLSEGTDLELAKKELPNSPFYGDLLISRDNKTTAIVATFKSDPVWQDLLQRRNALREQKLEAPLSPEEEAALVKVSAEFTARNTQNAIKLDADIKEARQIIEPYKATASIHMGGVPMIAADSIAFIENDLNVFSIAVFAFIVLLLSIIFRQIRWVMLPILNCGLTALALVGFMGLMDWPVTIVSSYFLSILMIITLSITVHLTVFHREYHAANPDMPAKDLALQMVRRMIAPCFFTSLTTIVAFGSLVISGIRPVIDFGWMMSIGICLAFVITFLFFPALLAMLPPPRVARDGALTNKVTGLAYDLVNKFPKGNLVAFTLLAVFTIAGIQQLSVENRFIDYYKEDTEVFQGMKVIDERLGGTTPLDIILDAPVFDVAANTGSTEDSSDDGFGEDVDDFFDSLEEEEEPGITDGFWFNGLMLNDIARIHNYLDSLPESGKVLSLHTAISMLRDIDPDSEIDTFYLSILLDNMPDLLLDNLIRPYVSEDGNQIRFSLRVHESDHGLKRQELLDKIHRDIANMDGMDLEPAQINTTGMLVLYNNVLQSLFESQILTVGFVFAAILVMFVISFRNLRMALLAIIPNMLAAGFVLGLMGWLGIPLDIMTITIAAICIGIAVDDCIHYVHRFKREFAQNPNYHLAAKHAHASIGHAMYYTTVTIAFGFSVMVFSNFVPTIYFGLLTGLAMIMALVANLLLLPVLIILFKPLGKSVD